MGKKADLRAGQRKDKMSLEQMVVQKGGAHTGIRKKDTGTSSKGVPSTKHRTSGFKVLKVPVKKQSLLDWIIVIKPTCYL